MANFIRDRLLLLSRLAMNSDLLPSNLWLSEIVTISGLTLVWRFSYCSLVLFEHFKYQSFIGYVFCKDVVVPPVDFLFILVRIPIIEFLGWIMFNLKKKKPNVQLVSIFSWWSYYFCYAMPCHWQTEEL